MEPYFSASHSSGAPAALAAATQRCRRGLGTARRHAGKPAAQAVVRIRMQHGSQAARTSNRARFLPHAQTVCV